MAAPGARLGIYDAIAANRWRTVALIGAFTAIVSALAYVTGEYFAPGGGIALLPIGLGVSAVSAATSYLAGDKLVLAQSRARAVGPGEEPQLRNIVETLAIGLGIQAPRLYVIEDSAPNAFATGRDVAHASIAVTRGLLDKLDRQEQE
ncbi:MAG: M48 family metalloprotease, partial [Chloroflexota bacterium]